MKCYVLQVMTNKEIKVRNALIKIGIKALVPREDRLIHTNGKWTTKEYVLFVGYVFVFIDFTPEKYYKIKDIDGIIKFLGFNGNLPIPISEAEIGFINTMAPDENPLQPSDVIISNGKVFVVNGALKTLKTFLDKEQSHIKFNLHSKRAKVPLSVLGVNRTVNLSFNIVSENN